MVEDRFALTRRSFLRLMGFAAATGLQVPAFSMPREAYVVAGESVSFIGLAKYPLPTFTGSTIVKEVHGFDGVGFPCTLMNQSFGCRYRPMPALFYDSDLCNPIREQLYEPWRAAARANPGRYYNMTSWIRELRYGERPELYRQMQDEFFGRSPKAPS